MEQFLLGVLTGAAVTLVTQFVTALLIKPILDLRELIGEIAASLFYHAPVYGEATRHDLKLKAQEVLRRQATILRAKANAVVLAGRWSLGVLPKRSDMIEASQDLIRLSHHAVETQPGTQTSMQAADLEDKIRTKLRIAI